MSPEQKVEKEARRASQRDTAGVPMWLQELRIRHCRCSSSGCCCSTGLIPATETSICHGRDQRERERLQKNRIGGRSNGQCEKDLS